MSGHGVENTKEGYRIATEYFEKAAKSGNREALHNLKRIQTAGDPNLGSSK